jgi:hypothetical protein
MMRYQKNWYAGWWREWRLLGEINRAGYFYDLKEIF